MKIADVIRTFLFIGLIITPFLSFFEISSLISGTLTSQSKALTPIYIKIIKDIVIFLIIILGFVYIFKKRRISIFVLSICIILFLIVELSIFRSLLYGNSDNNNLLAIISGFRWFYPICLFFVISDFMDDHTFDFIERGMKFIFYLNFLFQLIEFFSGVQWFGVYSTGFSIRNPGIFLMPNTAAFFVVIFTHIIFVSKNISLFKRNSYLILCAISIGLTASGTGFLVYTFILILYMLPVFIIPFFSVFVSPLIIAMGIYFIQNIRGTKYVEVSGGTRLSIIKDTFSDTSFISNQFGTGTNTYVLASTSGNIMDSYIASIIQNTGYIGLIFFILIVFYVFLVFMKKKEMLILLLCVMAFSFTTIITEVYPVNLIIPFLFLYKKNRE